MAAVIQRLIDKLDGFEIVRNKVGAILLLESQHQQTLALAASRDMNDWAFRVFSERTNPIGEFLDIPDDASSPPLVLPIVNVWYNGTTFDKSASNLVERQKGTSTINVDVYTYATSADQLVGHSPGDERAARELHRVVRLVRNILMAGSYTYLGLRGFVWERWLPAIEIFEPPTDGRAAQRIGAARLGLQVVHNEFSPQYEGVPLEGVDLSVLRRESGELYIEADFNFAGAESP